MDNNVWHSRCNAFGAGRVEPEIVLAFEPHSALVTDVTQADRVRLLRGAWAWACRKVLQMNVPASAKQQFAITRDTLDEALALFAEKRIAPVEWMSWRAIAHQYFHASKSLPTMHQLVSISSLRNRISRNQFRNETTHAFGGRAILLEDVIDARAAKFEKQSLEKRWRDATLRGAAFPTNLRAWVDMVSARLQEKQNERSSTAENGVPVVVRDRAGNVSPRRDAPRSVAHGRKAAGR